MNMPDPDDSVANVYANIARHNGWIKFVAVFHYIGGILLVLTCIGILFGWFPIRQGSILMKPAIGILFRWIPIWQGAITINPANLS